MPETPEERRLHATIAISERWSRLTAEQRAEQTRHAREGLLRKYLDRQPADLPHEERVRLAYSARRADQARHALKASIAARQARAARAAASDAA